jgi:hypothetical protein
MIDALLGSVIMVAATGALALLVEVSELAISSAVRPCSLNEQSIVVASAKDYSYAGALDECSKVAQWMADLRGLR